MTLTEKYNVDEVLLNVLFQACGWNGENDNKLIDNSCLSAYEDACEYLEGRGLLKARNPRIYEIVKEVKGK